ncbi:MAG TPA: LD-carboxypeptidase [Steroidobacteraceae bacterium]
MAPAGPFERPSFDAGLACLAERYRVQYTPGIFERQRYLAGEDARRLAELNSALADPAIQAVFCARGGYGAMRLLAKLAPPPERMKPLVGFSDITALHFWCQRHGFVSIHGPVLTQLGSQTPQSHARLFSLLESELPAAPILAAQTLVAGGAEGPLLGGNLSVVTRLLGTPFLPPLDGAILLLEDLAERPYRLDRMWTHLELAGVFRQISGIALGAFTGCEDRDTSYTSAQVLRDLAAATGLPCAAGFPIGHGERNDAVPLGTRVQLDATARTLTFLEGAVA